MGKKDPAIFQCQSCHKVFSRRHNMLLHLANAHTKKLHRCNVCRRSFGTADALVVHSRRHAAQRPHACRVCGKRYAYRIDLARHSALHEGGGTVPCAFCGERFAANRALVEHLRSHTDERARECPVCFGVHTPSEGHSCEQASPPEQLYSCRTCRRQFPDLVECLKHMKAHRDDGRPRCATCGQRFANALSLKSHLKFHERDKSYECRQCGEAFSLYADFIGHKRSHLGGETSECVYCGKAFVKKYELRNHMLLHVDEKPFKCSVCAKLFCRKDALRRHVRHFHGDAGPRAPPARRKRGGSLNGNRRARVVRDRGGDAKEAPGGGRSPARPNSSGAPVLVDDDGLFDQDHVEAFDFVGFKQEIPLARIDDPVRPGVPEGLTTRRGDTSPPAECAVCRCLFASEAARTYHHMREHFADDFAQCRICGQVFYGQMELLVHHDTSHSDEC